MIMIVKIIVLIIIIINFSLDYFLTIMALLYSINYYNDYK
jgi:hypothetical protein